MRVLLPPAMRREPERNTARYLWTVRELEVCRKDGSVFPAHLSIAKWWAGGHRHFTGILRRNSSKKFSRNVRCVSGFWSPTFEIMIAAKRLPSGARS